MKTFKTFADLGFDNTICPLGGLRTDSFLSLSKKLIPSLRHNMVLKAFQMLEQGEEPWKKFENELDFIRATFPHEEFIIAFKIWDFLRSNRISDRSQVTPEMKMMADQIKFKG